MSTVRIQFKLYAMLSDYLPQRSGEHQRQGNVLEMDLPEGTTITDLVEQHKLPARWVHLVLVDGKYIDPQERATRVLADGEALAIWPPVAGG